VHTLQDLGLFLSVRITWFLPTVLFISVEVYAYPSG
jgi:hypothetical protein